MKLHSRPQAKSINAGLPGGILHAAGRQVQKYLFASHLQGVFLTYHILALQAPGSHQLSLSPRSLGQLRLQLLQRACWARPLSSQQTMGLPWRMGVQRSSMRLAPAAALAQALHQGRRLPAVYSRWMSNSGQLEEGRCRFESWRIELHNSTCKELLH